jgi:hypothetical protein
MLPEKRQYTKPRSTSWTSKRKSCKIYKSQTIACEETTKNETVVEDVIYNGGIGFEF